MDPFEEELMSMEPVEGVHVEGLEELVESEDTEQTRAYSGSSEGVDRSDASIDQVERVGLTQDSNTPIELVDAKQHATEFATLSMEEEFPEGGTLERELQGESKGIPPTSLDKNETEVGFEAFQDAEDSGVFKTDPFDAQHQQQTSQEFISFNESETDFHDLPPTSHDDEPMKVEEKAYESRKEQDEFVGFEESAADFDVAMNDFPIHEDDEFKNLDNEQSGKEGLSGFGRATAVVETSAQESDAQDQEIEEAFTGFEEAETDFEAPTNDFPNQDDRKEQHDLDSATKEVPLYDNQRQQEQETEFVGFDESPEDKSDTQDEDVDEAFDASQEHPQQQELQDDMEVFTGFEEANVNFGAFANEFPIEDEGASGQEVQEGSVTNEFPLHDDQSQIQVQHDKESKFADFDESGVEKSDTQDKEIEEAFTSFEEAENDFEAATNDFPNQDDDELGKKEQAAFDSVAKEVPLYDNEGQQEQETEFAGFDESPEDKSDTQDEDVDEAFAAFQEVETHDSAQQQELQDDKEVCTEAETEFEASTSDFPIEDEDASGQEVQDGFESATNEFPLHDDQTQIQEQHDKESKFAGFDESPESGGGIDAFQVSDTLQHAEVQQDEQQADSEAFAGFEEAENDFEAATNDFPVGDDNAEEDETGATNEFVEEDAQQKTTDGEFSQVEEPTTNNLLRTETNDSAQEEEVTAAPSDFIIDSAEHGLESGQQESEFSAFGESSPFPVDEDRSYDTQQGKESLTDSLVTETLADEQQAQKVDVEGEELSSFETTRPAMNDAETHRQHLDNEQDQVDEFGGFNEAELDFEASINDSPVESEIPSNFAADGDTQVQDGSTAAVNGAPPVVSDKAQFDELESAEDAEVVETHQACSGSVDSGASRRDMDDEIREQDESQEEGDKLESDDDFGDFATPTHEPNDHEKQPKEDQEKQPKEDQVKQPKEEQEREEDLDFGDFDDEDFGEFEDFSTPTQAVVQGKEAGATESDKEEFGFGDEGDDDDFGGFEGFDEDTNETAGHQSDQVLGFLDLPKEVYSSAAERVFAFMCEPAEEQEEEGGNAATEEVGRKGLRDLLSTSSSPLFGPSACKCCTAKIRYLSSVCLACGEPVVGLDGTKNPFQADEPAQVLKKLVNVENKLQEISAMEHHLQSRDDKSVAMLLGSTNFHSAVSDESLSSHANANQHGEPGDDVDVRGGEIEDEEESEPQFTKAQAVDFGSEVTQALSSLSTPTGQEVPNQDNSLEGFDSFQSISSARRSSSSSENDEQLRKRSEDEDENETTMDEEETEEETDAQSKENNVDDDGFDEDFGDFEGVEHQEQVAEPSSSSSGFPFPSGEVLLPTSAPPVENGLDDGQEQNELDDFFTFSGSTATAPSKSSVDPLAFFSDPLSSSSATRKQSDSETSVENSAATLNPILASLQSSMGGGELSESGKALLVRIMSEVSSTTSPSSTTDEPLPDLSFMLAKGLSFPLTPPVRKASSLVDTHNNSDDPFLSLF